MQFLQFFDFMGFKNQIGVFDSACESYICSELLSTLPARELNSAWAEIIKHYLIHDGESFREFTKIDNKNTAELYKALETLNNGDSIQGNNNPLI